MSGKPGLPPRGVGVISVLLGLFLLLGPVPVASAAPVVAPSPIAFETRTLANGLQVYTARDETTPNITVQVWYRVGSKDDPAGRSGFAHLFEHLMFKATRDLPPETMDRLTEDVGGFNNASTYDDFTNYYEVAPAAQLERLIWAEAQRMGSLVVDEDGFGAERDVVKEELRQRVLADPYGRLFGLALPRATYSVHPYRRPGIGSIEELDAATIDDVRRFHQAYYRPDNAALIVIGNFDQARLDGWIDQYFGPLARPLTPIDRKVVVEPPRTAERRFEISGPNVPLPAVVLTWLGPAAASPDAAPLRVLDAILSAGRSSRLYERLVYERQLASEIFSSADLPAEPGMFAVGAVLANGQSVEAVEAALLDEITAIQRRGVSQAALEEAINELLASALRERETIDGRAFAIGQALMLAGDAQRADADLAALQTVTRQDVRRVARIYLDPARRHTLVYRQGKGEDPAVAPPTESAAPMPAYSGPVYELAPPGQRAPPPPQGPALRATLPQPVEMRLENGLRVIVARSSSLPLVSAVLSVDAGAWTDPEDRAGAAGLVADMLTQGTSRRNALQIARETEALGAELGASASSETAEVSLSALSSTFPKALAIMADVVMNPSFQPEELARRRALALDNLQVAYKEPASLAGLLVRPLLYGGQVYGRPLEGSPRTLALIDTSTLRALHQARYRPDRASLVLAGDIDPETGFALARAAFGAWRAPGPDQQGPAPVAESRPARRAVVDLPGSGQAVVRLFGEAPARGDPDYYTALVANAVLGGGYSARLNQEIRIRRGLSYGAASQLNARRGLGFISAGAQTKTASAPEVLDILQAEIAGLSLRPPQSGELEARRSVLTGSFGRQVATADGLAATLAGLVASGLRPEEIGSFQARVEAVSAEAVADYARRRLDPERMGFVIVGDAEDFMAELVKRQGALGLLRISAERLDMDAPDLQGPPQGPDAPPVPSRDVGSRRRS